MQTTLSVPLLQGGGLSRTQPTLAQLTLVYPDACHPTLLFQTVQLILDPGYTLL